MNTTAVFLNACRPLLGLGGLLAALGLSACQGLPSTHHCPSAQDTRPDSLYGTWTAQLIGEPLWLLTLGPHPEHAGSLRGELTAAAGPDPKPRAVVADLDNGEFTLEETHDGQRIAATWLGRLHMVDCAQTIIGERQEAGTKKTPQRFEIRSDRLR